MKLDAKIDSISNIGKNRKNALKKESLSVTLLYWKNILLQMTTFSYDDY